MITKFPFRVAMRTPDKAESLALDILIMPNQPNNQRGANL